MGYRFKHWKARSHILPQSYESLSSIIFTNRDFTAIAKLEYGDNGLDDAYKTLVKAITTGKRIALYADYDVDGTMSCVSWIWFFKAIGFHNFVHYIPDRFKEGYGVNLQAVQHLVQDEGAELIITMDTGITANEEAAWCRAQGVEFICTDHHKIQPEHMPDCIILNPKLHPDPLYQELCGCGITFVLLRKLGEHFKPPAHIWNDILALTGMATICDVVPLNGVNHKLAQYGVQALLRSQRPVFKKLLKAAAVGGGSMDERDIGFRLGPRINAVGRLEHAHKVIEAFVQEDPQGLIEFMTVCNERRKQIQAHIVSEAREVAKAYASDPILFLGGDWHQGVVGIAASKLAEEFWKPVWLFHRPAAGSNGVCKGSARTIPGFDVTDAMTSARDLFTKFGGHKAAGGYTFAPEREEAIRARLCEHARSIQQQSPGLWESTAHYDCHIPLELLELGVTSHLDELRPYGHCFEEPVFCLEARVEGTRFYDDKKTGEPKHTAVQIRAANGARQKIMFFNEVYEPLVHARKARFLVTAARNHWQGQDSLSLLGTDFEILS